VFDSHSEKGSVYSTIIHLAKSPYQFIGWITKNSICTFLSQFLTTFKRLPVERANSCKLFPFQKFMCVMLKLSSTRYSLPLSGFTINSIKNSFKMVCADGYKTQKIDCLA